jgi:signal transduction histidine kinase
VWADRAVAVLFTIGAIADAASQPHRALGALAIASLVVLTGSIAWRRTDPVAATVAAVSGLITFTVASHYNGDGSFEVAAIALNFYSLGRRSPSLGNAALLTVLFGYWLAAAAIVASVPPGGTVGSVIGPWLFAGVLPFAIGLILERRRALTSEFRARTDRLRDEQEIRARRAAAEERNRMARELHDVIAHCVSVMVVQTTAAGRVARIDLQAARGALQVVENAGREALVELRRIVGVLRHSRDDLAGRAAPGLAQLGALVERSRAAGLPVELRVEGQTGQLSPDLDLVAYRFVQEALTNAIKHAGDARADVSVDVGTHELQMSVSDSGRGPACGERDGNGIGHGLVGMAERVKLYGGELQAGRGPGGGFLVSARIPLDLNAPTARSLGSAAGGHGIAVEGETGFRWPWLDPGFAVAALVVMELAILTTAHRHGALALNLVVVAGIALAAVWHRRSPLLFLVVVAVLGSLMNAYLTPLKTSPLIAAYFVLVPSYSVAAWAEREEAVLGLSLFLGGAAISELVLHRGSPGEFIGAAFTVGAAWAVGRAMRSYRRLTSELERMSARLAIEREDRARLAVAAERSRIARELHAAIAASVTAMVVQAQAALSLLAHDLEQACAVMGSLENVGREALADMRRVLGVLRHGDERAELAPQPGVDQIYALIQQARDRGQSVALTVDGDAGALAAGVELGLYRILENALQSARRRDEGAVGVSLRFGEEDLEVRLTARCRGPNGWPTDAMRERVALCGGQLEPDAGAADGWRFAARMPRGLKGAFV